MTGRRTAKTAELPPGAAAEPGPDDRVRCRKCGLREATNPAGFCPICGTAIAAVTP